MTKAAVLLSGCGHRDGAEITEAVSALVALSELNVTVQVFAPDMKIEPTDHISGNPMVGETRNLLTEAARMARGRVKPLPQLHVKDYDVLVLPGGFGVALHLCTWATDGAACAVLPDVDTVVREFYRQQKPIGAICIAPALIAKVLGSYGIHITLGQQSEAAQEVQKTGARHVECAVDDFVTDREHRIVTTPAYMYPQAKPFEIFTGVRRAMRELISMA